MLILPTTSLTPLPKYLFLSLSLNSIASYSPVDAPDGTEARAKIPELVVMSTSTVGFPLESKISLAIIYSISVFNFLSFKIYTQVKI